MEGKRPAYDRVAGAIGPEPAQLCVVTLCGSTCAVTKGAFAEISPLVRTSVRFAPMPAPAFGVLAARGC